MEKLRSLIYTWLDPRFAGEIVVAAGLAVGLALMASLSNRTASK